MKKLLLVSLLTFGSSLFAGPDIGISIQTPIGNGGMLGLNFRSDDHRYDHRYRHFDYDRYGYPDDFGYYMDILIELDIFIIIFSFYMMADIHIMIDYIVEGILILIVHIIENIDITKIMTGIDQEIIEMIENLFMVIIMKEIIIKGEIIDKKRITNKEMIEIISNKMIIEIIKNIKKTEILMAEMNIITDKTRY